MKLTALFGPPMREIEVELSPESEAELIELRKSLEDISQGTGGKG